MPSWPVCIPMEPHRHRSHEHAEEEEAEIQYGPCFSLHINAGSVPPARRVAHARWQVWASGSRCVKNARRRIGTVSCVPLTSNLAWAGDPGASNAGRRAQGGRTFQPGSPARAGKPALLGRGRQVRRVGRVTKGGTSSPRGMPPQTLLGVRPSPRSCRLRRRPGSPAGRQEKKMQMTSHRTLPT